MQLLPTLDNVLYNVQRQGKISFYVSFLHGLPVPALNCPDLDDYSKFTQPAARHISLGVAHSLFSDSMEKRQQL